MSKSVTGTREWASVNKSIQLGCQNNCRYCYAREFALRYKRISKPEEWNKPVILGYKVEEQAKKEKGTVLCFSTHDIVPEILDECIIVLRKLLEAGNKVLIVSKPRFDCMEKLTYELLNYRKQMLFRFTIGSLDNKTLKFWEPNAPCLGERFETLKLVFNRQFKTSVSCEPLLDSDAIALFYGLKSYVTDSIWLGALNKPTERIEGLRSWSKEDKKFYEYAMLAKSPTMVAKYYEALKHEPLVRWKESFKHILGLESPEKIGLDI